MKIKNIVMLAGTLVAGLLFAEPQPYSFLKNFKGGWDRRKPVEFITEADGSRILKLGGSDDYKMRGSLDIKNIDKALESFRGYEVDFVVEYKLENAKLCPNQWAKDRPEDFKLILWHWEHANAEYSSWVRPVVKFPEGGNTDGWVTERFHSCVMADDELGKAGVGLMATFGTGGSIYFKDFRIEVSPHKVMEEAAAKVGVKIPEGYKCEYSEKWLDGKKYRGTVCIWEFGPQDLEKIVSWGCNLVRMSRFKPLTDDYNKLEERLAVLKKHNVKVIFAPMAPGGRGNRKKYAIFNDDQMRADFIKGWEKLATYFKGRDDIWAFGILNEPFQNYFGNQDDKYSYWGLVHDAIKAIRAIDPDRCIVATADTGGSPADYRPPYMLPYPFKDVWYELHFYSPLVMTHYGVLGKDINPEKDRYPGLTVRKLHVWNKEMLGKVLDESKFFGDKYGAKFFVGEFSCHRTVPDAAQWLDDAADEIDKRFDLWAYHSYGEYDGWNLEYKEDKWGVKAEKCAPGEESARMKVMKKHWSRNAEK